jgi:hypothetical protein
MRKVALFTAVVVAATGTSVGDNSCMGTIMGVPLAPASEGQPATNVSVRALPPGVGVGGGGGEEEEVASRGPRCGGERIRAWESVCRDSNCSHAIDTAGRGCEQGAGARGGVACKWSRACTRLPGDAAFAATPPGSPPHINRSHAAWLATPHQPQPRRLAHHPAPIAATPPGSPCHIDRGHAAWLTAPHRSQPRRLAHRLTSIAATPPRSPPHINRSHAAWLATPHQSQSRRLARRLTSIAVTPPGSPCHRHCIYAAWLTASHQSQPRCITHRPTSIAATPPGSPPHRHRGHAVSPAIPPNPPPPAPAR